MTREDTSISRRTLPLRNFAQSWVGFVAILAAVGALTLVLASGGDLGLLWASLVDAPWAPHAPDLSRLLAAGPAVIVHVATVLAALVIGVVLLTGKKGRTTHRVLGWTWVAMMLTTAVAALFIRTADGGLSPIHIFTAVTLLFAPLGVYQARRHHVRTHARTMQGLFYGGLILAGVLAFLPGRMMYAMVFG